MTTVCTISNEEMVARCACAAGALYHGAEAVVLQPGVFRASGWSPAKVISEVLGELRLTEHLEPQEARRTWKVWITRRSDGKYVLQASN